MQTRSCKRPAAACSLPDIRPKRPAVERNKIDNKTKTATIIEREAKSIIKSGQSTIVEAFSQRRQSTIGTDTQKAKRALHASAIPCKLHGREAENNTIRTFWKQCLVTNRADSLYISGSPGTGKTATIDTIEGEMRELYKEGHFPSFIVVKINCMKVIDPKEIYTILLQALTNTTLMPRKAADELEKLLCPTEKQDILATLILDEVDQLSTKDQEILYRLFELPKLRNSRLVLIAIANALDLTDRLLPRLRAKDCEPQYLNFNPYTKDQISSIIGQRLSFLHTNQSKPLVPVLQTSLKADSQLNTTSNTQIPNHNHTLALPSNVKEQPMKEQFIFDTNAIDLCARKVAATSGDIRKALDICRKAIEMAEIARKKRISAMKSTSNANENASLAVNPPAVLRVTLQDVIAVTKLQSESTIMAKLKDLSIHSQFILATLLTMKANHMASECTLGKVHDHYAQICRQKIKAPVTPSEYFDLCDQLAMKGIIEIAPKPQEKRMRKINLRVDEGDVCTAFKDNFLIAPLLIGPAKPKFV